LMVNRRKAIDIGERKGIWLPQVDDLRTQYKKGAPFGVRFGCLPQTIQKGTPF